MTLEERSRLGAAAIGLPWAILTARHAYVRWIRREEPLRTIVAASLAGALVGPLAVVLMSMKVALHLHTLPDYQTDDLQAMLTGIPMGAGLGLLFGAGLALLRGEWPPPSDS